MNPDSLARRIAVHAAVIFSYVVVAFVHLRPLAARFAETIPRGERMDVLLHGWIINWTARQLSRGPWDLFQANLFFPHADALTYTEHMVPEALPVVPVWAITGDPVLTYNVAYLLTFVLGGWGTFLLVRRLTGNAWAAWVAGVFACFFPAKRWSMAHVNTIAVHYVPFAMLALHRLLETPTMGRALLAGVLVAMASLVSAYYTVYLPLLLAVAVPMIFWAEGRAIDRRRVGGLLVAALAAAAIALPLLLPYLQTWSGGEEPARSYDLQIAGAADVAEFFILDSLLWSRFLLPDALDPLTTPFFPGLVATLLVVAGLFGSRTAARTDERRDGAHPGEHQRSAIAMPSSPAAIGARAGGYLCLAGFAALAIPHLVRHHRSVLALQAPPAAPAGSLALLAAAAVVLLAIGERRAFPAVLRLLWRRFRASSPLARIYGATAAFALLMALGPQLKFFGYTGPILPYHWIYYGVPGAAALRAPYRAAILGQAFVAVVIGFGVAWLLRRVAPSSRVAAAVAVALGAAVVAESVGDALPLRDLPAPASAVYEHLAAEPGDFGILDWPISSLIDNTAEGQWLSTRHWKRRVTGHNGRLPVDIQELHALAQDWPPSVAFLRRLRDQFPVRYVVVHLHAFEPATRRQVVDEILPSIASWWSIERDFGEDLLVRVRNGGPGAGIERRFAGWMVRGTLVVELESMVPAGGDWRLGVVAGDRTLDPVALRPGEQRIEVPLTGVRSGRRPVAVRVAVEGPSGRTLSIERVSFETPEGLIYP